MIDFILGIFVGFVIGWQLMALRVLRIIERKQRDNPDAPTYQEDI